jgi:hypothetical protein
MKAGPVRQRRRDARRFRASRSLSYIPYSQACCFGVSLRWRRKSSLISRRNFSSWGWSLWRLHKSQRITHRLRHRTQNIPHRSLPSASATQDLVGRRPEAMHGPSPKPP